MEIKECPIIEMDYHGEYPCEHEDEISYKYCYECANGLLEELKEFIKQLEREKNGNKTK